jgi:hypothetical protein
MPRPTEARYAMSAIDSPAAERQRTQRRRSVRMALVLAAAAAMVFSFYIYQVARMAG